MQQIGFVREGPGVSRLIRNGTEGEFLPKFREAPYTPLKKVVDRPGRDFEEMKKGIDRAALASREKKERMLRKLK
jgi:hydrogenase expression/formation protein